jgi:DNA modification methylase
MKNKFDYYIQCGDCLDILPDLSTNSIDMVLCDPPYGTTACKWDTVIPFEEMWRQLKRIRRKKSVVVLFGYEPFSSNLRVSNIHEFKYDWIWYKGAASNFFAAKFMPLIETEIISVFSTCGCNNGALFPIPYNPQNVHDVNKIIINGKNVGGKLGKAHKTTMMSGREYIQKTTGYPKNILYFTRDKKAEHPTQKPVALLEYLIKTYTNPGQIVLDFTMGSGSTGVACKNTNRKFIGIELDEKYFKIARKRLTGKI